MINLKQFEAAQLANKKIQQALAQRIPCLSEYRFDDNPDAVSPVDFFGNADTMMHFGSTRTWLNQYKSRRAGASEICFECRSYRGKFINPQTQKPIKIAGAYYYEPGGCWITPRLGNVDCMTICLPAENDDNDNIVMHFSRYYLDILFSGNVWQYATRFKREYDDTDTYLVFFDYKVFIDKYIECVGRVTCGEKYTIVARSDEEIKNVLGQQEYASNNNTLKNNN